MKTRWRIEADEWSPEGQTINDGENLAAIRETLEERGPVIVEHRFYRGASAPDRLFFEEYEEFIAYLEEHSFAGDAIYVWDFAALCRTDNSLASGKCPDEKGEVPRKGAY